MDEARACLPCRVWLLVLSRSASVKRGEEREAHSEDDKEGRCPGTGDDLKGPPGTRRLLVQWAVTHKSVRCARLASLLFSLPKPSTHPHAQGHTSTRTSRRAHAHTHTPEISVPHLLHLR